MLVPQRIQRPRAARWLVVALSAVVTSVPLAAAAEVSVTGAWVRGTVAGQRSTGAFMTLTSTSDAALVAAASPVAGIVEIHEMAMEGGVMKMRAVGRLPLPAGKAVELKPGGYHVMLMALRNPLGEGATVPITLTLEDAAGKRQTVEVKAAVRPLAAPPPGHTPAR